MRYSVSDRRLTCPVMVCVLYGGIDVDSGIYAEWCNLSPAIGYSFFGGGLRVVFYRVFRVEFNPICREWANQKLVGDKSGALC